MRRTMICLAISCLSAASTYAQQPECAIVVVIDGLRNDEGFEARDTNLYHIWNDLGPLGTVNLRFWNRGWTATTGGHTTILSGVRQMIRNNGGIEQDSRSFAPLLWEYYRKHAAVPESACGTVVGKWGNVGSIADFGLDPSYGEPWRGFHLGEDTHDDTACSRLVHEVLDSLHPRLLLVNLGSVDARGHDSIYEDYVAAAREADSIVYEFYRHIQAMPPYEDTFYRDRTVIFVTSDHGRNDDAHGSFKGHGEWDHGSRHVMFLALGPGIAAGRVVEDTPRDAIDIVPTLAAVLGVPVPFAEGRVMTELFEDRSLPVSVVAPGDGPADAANISDNPGFSRDPDLCLDRAGNLHLVWSDDTPGKWSVLYTRSTDNGETWMSARVLFDYAGDDSVVWFARVAADDSVAVAGIGFGKHACYIDSIEPRRADTTFLWYPRVATSDDGGTTWGTVSLFDSSMVSCRPGVSVRDGRYGVAWWQHGKFPWEVTGKGVNFRGRRAGGAWDSLPAVLTGKQATHVCLVDDGERYHAAAALFKSEDWDIGYYSSTGGDSWEQHWVTDDPDGSPVYDCDPALVVDDSGAVHVCWSRKENSGGAWRVMYGRMEPAVGQWDTTTLSTGPSGAWQPHAGRRGDTLAVVWTDYRDGNPEVYARYSPDRGLSWSAEVRVTASDGLSHRPHVSATAGGFYVVWQEYAGGNWDIRGEPLDASAGVRGIPGHGSRAFPTVIRDVLLLPRDPSGRRPGGALFDAAGRRVMALGEGVNEVAHVPDGVYFVKAGPAYDRAKVVVRH